MVASAHTTTRPDGALHIDHRKLSDLVQRGEICPPPLQLAVDARARDSATREIPEEAKR